MNNSAPAQAQVTYNPYIDPGYTLLAGYRDSDARFFDYAIAGGMGMGWNVNDQFVDKKQWWINYKDWHENSPVVKYHLPSAYFGIGAAYGLGANLTTQQVIDRMDAWLAPEPGIETYPELLPAFTISEENYTGDGKWELMNTAATHVMQNYGVPVFQWLLPENQDDGGIPGTEPDPFLAAGGWVYNPVFHVDQNQFRRLTMKYVSMGKPVHVNIWASDPEWHHDYGSVEALIAHGQGQFDVAKEFNLNASIFAVVNSSVNVWKGSPREDIQQIRDWIADVRADMNSVAPGTRDPLESANFSTGDGISGGSNQHGIPSVYQEDFLGFDWIEDADLTGFLDMQLTSAPETNPGYLLAKVNDAQSLDSSLTYRLTSDGPLGYVSLEVTGAAPTATNASNSLSISVDGINWMPFQQQSASDNFQTFGITATADFLQGSHQAYLRIKMQNEGGAPGTAANALDHIKISSGNVGHAIWWNDWGTTEQQGAWSESLLAQPNQDLDDDGLANQILLYYTEGKSYWGTQRIDAPLGALIDDIRIEWEVETFQYLNHGVTWGIEVSTTGEFNGEQTTIVSEPGVTAFLWNDLILDLTDNAEFSKVPHFFLRLWGDNTSPSFYFDARPINVYANYVTIPEPATLTLMLTLAILPLCTRLGTKNSIF